MALAATMTMTMMGWVATTAAVSRYLVYSTSDYIIIYIISCISESVSSGTRQVLVLSICLLRSSDDKKGKRAALLGLQGMVALAGAMSQPALSQRMASWQRPGRWSASPSAMPRPASR